MKNYACRLISLITLISYSSMTICWPQEQEKFYANEYRYEDVPPPAPSLPSSSFGNEHSYGNSSSNNSGPAVAVAAALAAAAYLYNQSQDQKKPESLFIPPEKSEKEREQEIRKKREEAINLAESRALHKQKKEHDRIRKAYADKKAKRERYRDPHFLKQMIPYVNKNILKRSDHKLGLDDCDGVDQQYVNMLEEIAETSDANNEYKRRQDSQVLDELNADHDQVQLPAESLLGQCRQERRQEFEKLKDQPLQISTQKFNLSPASESILRSYDIDSDLFTLNVGNQYNHLIHKQINDLLESAVQHAQDGADIIAQMAIDAAQAAAQFNKEYCVIPAISMTDVGNALLDFSKGVLVGIAVEGAITGVVCLVSVTCPVLAPAVAMSLHAMYYYQLSKAAIFVAQHAYDRVDIYCTATSQEEYDARMAEKNAEFKGVVKEVCSPHNLGMMFGGAYASAKVNNWFFRRANIHYENAQKNGLHNEILTSKKTGGNTKKYEPPEPHTSTPVGWQKKGTKEWKINGNKETIINNRLYKKHAIDRMQGRGIFPTVVENTIQIGRKYPGNTPGTTAHYDPCNDITVITANKGDHVITVKRGQPRGIKK